MMVPSNPLSTRPTQMIEWKKLSLRAPRFLYQGMVSEALGLHAPASRR